MHRYFLGVFVALFILFLTVIAFADTDCQYDKSVQTNWTHKIEKTENYQKKVYPYVDDTRKCIVSMDVTINSTSYYTHGEYVFGPDMSENNACEQAVIKAKKKVISKVSPEILSAKTEMNCKTSEQMPEHTPAPVPHVKLEEKPITRTIITTHPPTYSERVISSRIISVTPVQNQWPTRRIGTTTGPVPGYGGHSDILTNIVAGIVKGLR